MVSMVRHIRSGIPRTGIFLLWLSVALMHSITARPASAQQPAEAAGRPPNVLLIMTDDQGWGDVHSHDNPRIDTPWMDRLASQGARFDRFFVSPVCAPTRASLMTGRYHLRCGVHGVTRGWETMRSREVTLAEAFRAAGYATGCFGKWHNGAHYPQDPNGQGFEQFFGFCAGHWNNYFDSDLQRNQSPVESQGFIIDTLTDEALRFIEGNHERPFFCYVPWNTPHTPWQVPDRYFDKYQARGLDTVTACAYAMCENIDDNLGRLLEKLDTLGLADNTIVLFLTDNGPNSDRFNGHMKGRKGSIHEGGVRVPLFVRYPGKIPAGLTIRPITSHIDLFPTLVALTGVPMPETLPLDGKNLVPLLRGEATDWPERLIFSHWNGRGSVRSPRYRATKGELYDMLSDPSQKKNLVEQQPEVYTRLITAYDAWVEEASREGFDPIPTEVGHAEAPIVTLLGHEAYLHPPSPTRRGDRTGLGISYNGRPGFANDWVTHWTSTEAYPSWPLKVIRAGRYEVTLLYGCPPDDVGARLRVEVGSASISGTVEKAHRLEALPRADRVPQDHGAHTDMRWAELPLGSLELPRGENPLVVRATHKPGSHVIDLKAVRLKRVE
jgi:arylsulfatase A